MSTDYKKEKDRMYQANKRAKDRNEPLPYPEVTKEQAEERLRRHGQNLEWARAQDAIGRYKSERSSCVDLLALFEGANIVDKVDEESENEDEFSAESKKKKAKQKKENRLNPSQCKITIRAIEYEGVKLEPNCDMAFRMLNEVDAVVSFEQWLELRDKARKNLFWLSRLLGRGLYHSFHQEMCDQFVQKNFDGMYFEGYTIEDFHDMMYKQVRFANDGVTPTREVLILDARGSYKSTVDGVDVVQWLLNCPDIRTMIITGFKYLAKRFLKEIKKYFYLGPRAQPTAFQLMFPEYVLTGVAGHSREPLECPARIHNQKDPSVWASSVESSDTGAHCDIRKSDDTVDPKNSTTKEMREQLKFDLDSTDDLVDPWGFTDYLGTRYFTDDWYGLRMRPNDNSVVAPIKYHCRGSWVVKPEYKDIPLMKLTKEMVTLLFPAKLSWSYLQFTLHKKGERSFRNQQMNDPTDVAAESIYINSFTKEGLLARCHPREWLQGKTGRIVQLWDWALSDRPTSDFSCGVTALIYERPDGQYAVCIIDVILDKWKDSQLVAQITAFYEKHHPEVVLIEQSNGADLLRTSLQNYALRHSSDIMAPGKIYWKPVSTANDAKRRRVQSLELLLAEERLDFINGPWMDEVFKQMCQYTGEKKNKSRKDDGPDAMAYVIEFLPRIALEKNIDPEVAKEEAEKLSAQRRLKEAYARMFGAPYTPPPPQPVSMEPPILSPPSAAGGMNILPPAMRRFRD
jgi:phage terminase large subunit-like protein